MRSKLTRSCAREDIMANGTRKVFLLCGLVVVCAALSARAQTLNVAPVVAMNASAEWGHNCNAVPPPPPAFAFSCGPVVDGVNFSPVGPGDDGEWRSLAICKGAFTSCGFAKASADVRIRLRGDTTTFVTLDWAAVANTRYRCCTKAYNYFGTASGATNSTFNIVVGGPAGAPAVVHFRWRQVSGNMYKPEGAGDDLPQNASGSLGVGGNGTFDGLCNLIGMAGMRFMQDEGQINTTGGSTIGIPLTINVDSNINPPSITDTVKEWDVESVAWWGSLQVWTILGPPECAPGRIEFGVDLGGDRELSMPVGAPNGRFDPGDTYMSQGGFVNNGGTNGFMNDLTLFGFDPSPTPGALPATAAPLCSGAPLVPGAFFDLDDFDRVGAPLTGLIPPGSPVGAPIPRFPSSCIHPLEFLYFSYDDDKERNYAAAAPCDYPAATVSGGFDGVSGAFGGSNYGSTATNDEVMLMPVIPRTPPTITWTALGVLSEIGLHTGLGSNPTLGAEAFDDDVDGLDIFPDAAACPVFVFTADHEALGPLAGFDGGTIFQWTAGGGVVPLITPAIHLGVPAGVDIKGLEFVFAAHPAFAGEYLALLFTVAPDDPSTAPDESGTLDPRMIYISYLDGAYTALLNRQMDDRIDALANYCTEVTTPPLPPTADIKPIFTNLPGDPSNVVPGLANGWKAGTSTQFDRPYLSPNQFRWVIGGFANEAANADRVVVAGSGPTRLGASLVLQEGPAPFAAGRRYLTTDTQLSINDSGQVAIAANLDGAVADDKVLVVYGVGTGFQRLVLRENQAEPTGLFPGNFVGDTIDSPNMLNDGRVGYKSLFDGLGAGAPVAPLTVANNDVLMIAPAGAGVHTVLAREGVTPVGPGAMNWDLFDPGDFFLSSSAATWIAQGNDEGPAATDQVLVLSDGAGPHVLLREGGIVYNGVPIDANAVLEASLSRLGNHWIANGSNSGAVDPQDWVVFDGVRVAGTDEDITPAAPSGETYDDTIFTTTFFAIAVNNRGDYVIGGLTSAANHNADAVIVFNRSRVVVREGDPVDMNDDGLANDNVFISLFDSFDLFLTDDRHLYFMADLRNGLSQSIGQGFLVIDLNQGPVCGSADFNCDGDLGTDADIEGFFSCLAGSCPPFPCASTADFNGDGDLGTDADIEAFFRVLAGGTC
jgi:hypothetical protein